MKRAPIFDRIDRAILRALRKDGRMAQAELGDRVNLSPTAARRRQLRLEQEGVITGYHAKFDQTRLGIGASAIVLVRLSRQTQGTLTRFETALHELRWVSQAWLVSGSFDYVLHVEAADQAQFNEVHRAHLASLPDVDLIQTLFTLRIAKDDPHCSVL